MAAPSVTNTFTNGTTADATEVNQNFTDVINGITDGTKDLTISALTVNGAAAFNGTVTLGNATGDDVVVTGYVASTVIPKTNAAYDLGSSSLGWQALYLDNDSTDGGAVYFDADGTTFIKCNAAGTNILVDGVTSFSTDCDITPNADASYDLGSTSLNFVALYLDNGATDGGAIYFNAGTTAFLKSDSSGADLDMGGFTGLDLGANCNIKTFGTFPSAKTADYTITDTDGVVHVLMTTSTTDRTVTLPTVADNTGRIITVTKVDSASGSVTIDGEGAETIDDATTHEFFSQYDSMTVQSDGSEWWIIDKKIANRWEVNVLTSNITADDSVIADLTFSNLVVGKIYRATLSARCNHNNVPDTQTTIDVTIDHNSVQLCFASFALDQVSVGAADNKTNMLNPSIIFEAAATTVTFGATVRNGSSGTASIVGNSASSGTYSMLEELNNYADETTAF
jgi:hypothetical protein